ncbi:PH domain-containing protein [Ekhidna lutea]|uniref:PH domain-containing protein n=1 Tax=Ekhidna lutea TaxID=447679 RepID=A0A239K5G6_EKHLU|nr:PH domain-containing protein [Ekhidna lutea]SNT12374.1 PH domain-containing protein [Ekhidna lutea]
MDLLTKFSVTKEEEPSENIDKVFDILIDGEKAEMVFSHVRDKVWFTTKRIIAMDVQGLTGSKKEYRSFPYSKISSFSIETAGTFDGDSDFKIWVSGVGMFEIKFSKKLKIKEVAKYLSNKVL